MKNIAGELSRIVEEFTVKISAISDAEFSSKPKPEKWSKKEILGHLVDSAHNNLRRFICGQYESTPPHIAYDQNFWVDVNGYKDVAKEDVLQLWRLMNEHICRVLNTMPPEKYMNECDMSNFSVQLRSLKWLAEDYVVHLKHHLNQIIPRSFDVVYKNDF